MRLEDSDPRGTLFECEVSSMVEIFPGDFLSRGEKSSGKSRGPKKSRKKKRAKNLGKKSLDF